MKLKPNGTQDLKPLPSPEVSDHSEKLGQVRTSGKVSSDPDKRARQLANLAKGKGMRKGQKTRGTQAVEALKAAIALVPQSPTATTPLGVLTYHMLRAQAEFERLMGVEVPEDEDAARELVSERRAALRLAIECATLAAPYMHAKLASVEQNVKAGLRVTVRGFGQKDGDGGKPVLAGGPGMATTAGKP